MIRPAAVPPCTCGYQKGHEGRPVRCHRNVHGVVAVTVLHLPIRVLEEERRDGVKRGEVNRVGLRTMQLSLIDAGTLLRE